MSCRYGIPELPPIVSLTEFDPDDVKPLLPTPVFLNLIQRKPEPLYTSIPYGKFKLAKSDYRHSKLYRKGHKGSTDAVSFLDFIGPYTSVTFFLFFILCQFAFVLFLTLSRQGLVVKIARQPNIPLWVVFR